MHEASVCAGLAQRHLNKCLHACWLHKPVVQFSCPSCRQDFGNFQDMEGKEREKTERLRFGRFFYRFPNGESGAGGQTRCIGGRW